MKLIEAEKAKDVIHEYFKSLMAKDASGANVYKLAVGIVSCLEHDANLLKAIDGLPSAEPDTTTHDSIPAKNGRNDEDRTSGDCISRQAAKDIFTELYGISAIGSVFDKYEWADICETTANELPSAQPEIIRCKDCKFGEQDEVGRWFCRSLGCQIGNEDGSGFCADAERRTDD